jgi:hypothetical protein
MDKLYRSSIIKLKNPEETAIKIIPFYIKEKFNFIVD